MNDELVSQDPDPAMSPLELERVHAWWRPDRHLSVGQIYLMDKPFVRAPLLPEAIKPPRLGHPGTTPGLNRIHVPPRDRALNEAIVVAETIDAIRTLTGFAPDAKASMRMTDLTPGMRGDFLARAASRAGTVQP